MSLKLAQPFEPDPTPSQPTPPPAGVRWIDLKEAAKRSGWNEGYIRRLCGDRWMAQGLAELRPQERGRSAWFVREDADQKFARVRSTSQLDALLDLRTLSSKQREDLLFKERVLREWSAAIAGGITMGMGRGEATKSFLASLAIRLSAEGGHRKCPSPATLYNWESAAKFGRATLLDGRADQADRQADKSSQFYDFLKHIYLSANQRGKAVCYQIAVGKAREQGWEFPSERTARRFLEKLPKAITTRKRKGDKAFTDEHEVFIERDYSTINSNDIWCGDHHNFDVMVTHNGVHVRPWLTAWMDMRSRKIVGWTIFAGNPNTDTILRAFLIGCKSHGTPRHVYVDNGKDYDSKALQGFTKNQRRKGEVDVKRVDGVFEILEIGCTHAQPYHGQSKPVERFFKTVCERFSKLFDCYCGNKPSNRPEDLQKHLDAGKALTVQEFSDAFGEWVEHDYHNRSHSGDSMHEQTPTQVHAACLIEKRTTDHALLEFACLPRVEATIRQNGVGYKTLRYGGFMEQIISRQGELVQLAVDERDITRVHVIGSDGRFICTAPLNERLPVNASREVLNTAMAEKRRVTKTQKAHHRDRTRYSDDLQTHLLREALASTPSGIASQEPPAPITPHRTQFDDQLKDIQKAMANTGKAVGAESLTESLAPGIKPASFVELMASKGGQDEFD